MTKIFCYHGYPDRMQMALGLIRKLYQQHKPVAVYAPEEIVANTLDQLLWTQIPLDFVPHCRMSSPLAEETPIVIGRHPDRCTQNQRLINLGHDIPSGFSRFDSVIEIISQDQTEILEGRERCRFYKEKGYQIEFFPFKDGQ